MALAAGVDDNSQLEGNGYSMDRRGLAMMAQKDWALVTQRSFPDNGQVYDPCATGNNLP